jgi:hypothetical protein
VRAAAKDKRLLTVGRSVQYSTVASIFSALFPDDYDRVGWVGFWGGGGGGGWNGRRWLVCVTEGVCACDLHAQHAADRLLFCRLMLCPHTCTTTYIHTYIMYIIYIHRWCLCSTTGVWTCSCGAGTTCRCLCAWLVCLVCAGGKDAAESCRPNESL